MAFMKNDTKNAAQLSQNDNCSKKLLTDAVVVTSENVKQICANFPSSAKAVFKALTQLKFGSLDVQLPNGQLLKFASSGAGPNAQVTLHNWNPTRRLVFGGTIGAGESFMEREWDSKDVTQFLQLFSANHSLANKMITPAWLSNTFFQLRHWLNSNSKGGSKRNIAAHYDLGNDFYSLWLDKSMTYSSALFKDDKTSLQAAQTAKYQSLIERTGISGTDKVLEIGCGWGGFAEYAAKTTDAHLTCLTISQEQLEFAQKRIFEAGLNEKVDLKFQDYRDENGAYDKIISIEMFEAVGEKYWNSYFETLNRCLKAGGKAGLQIITIAEKSFDSYQKRPDFIQRYIFPGGMLPTPTHLSTLASNVGFDEETPVVFAKDYARTLAVWREVFLSKWDQIELLGFDDRFKRMWEFYLHYCEAGFLTQNTDVRQVFYAKP
ncbi:MAG: class I SAM-dependent methyltransferase [Nitratireductor sp.]